MSGTEGQAAVDAPVSAGEKQSEPVFQLKRKSNDNPPFYCCKTS